MQISRRNALMGATAAAVVAGVPGAVDASDPAIGLAEKLNTASKTWRSVDDRFEDPCRHEACI